MGFFKSSKSHLEQLEAACRTVSESAAAARLACDASLRGKFEYMAPEQRADLVRKALDLSRSMNTALASARANQAAMEADQCPKEELLTAQSVLLAAGLDAQGAQKALDEARNSLATGMEEIEKFYGPASKEAKHLKRILSEIRSGA